MLVLGQCWKNWWFGTLEHFYIPIQTLDKGKIVCWLYKMRSCLQTCCPCETPWGTMRQHGMYSIQVLLLINLNLTFILLEKSNSPTVLNSLSWSAAISIKLPRERGFPSLALTHVPERSRQLLGLPDLASCVSSYSLLLCNILARQSFI